MCIIFSIISVWVCSRDTISSLMLSVASMIFEYPGMIWYSGLLTLWYSGILGLFNGLWFDTQELVVCWPGPNFGTQALEACYSGSQFGSRALFVWLSILYHYELHFALNVQCPVLPWRTHPKWQKKESSGSLVLRTCMAIIMILLTIERDSLMTRLVVMTLKNMELKRGFLKITKLENRLPHIDTQLHLHNKQI